MVENDCDNLSSVIKTNNKDKKKNKIKRQTQHSQNNWNISSEMSTA